MGHMFAIGIAALVLVACSELGRTGRRVNAVRDDPELAASMGIRVRRYRLAAFVVSGALGGCAGCMNILVRSAVSPLDIGFGLIVLALTMIIVGGALSWKGAADRRDHLHLAARPALGHRRVAGADLRHHRRDRRGASAARHLRPLRRLQAGRAPRAPPQSPAASRRRSRTKTDARATIRPHCSSSGADRDGGEAMTAETEAPQRRHDPPPGRRSSRPATSPSTSVA